ncbi:MAG: phosphonate C-P lyase system protein PhnG [Beijerinckiaceae bacterium]
MTEPLSSFDPEARRRAMGLLARATLDELGPPLDAAFGVVAATDLKPVETGLVMLRGRMGGDGSAFNMGETTVTRAIVSLSDGLRGYGFIVGRDRKLARLAAIADALWQRPDARAVIEREILAPVAARLASDKVRAQTETAATRVDFFTLVRGED